jgi:hypothetical protein
LRGGGADGEPATCRYILTSVRRELAAIRARVGHRAKEPKRRGHFDDCSGASLLRSAEVAANRRGRVLW